MEKEELKRRCLDVIDAHRAEIIALGNDVYKTPELGYKEFKTTERVAQAFREIGLEPETEIAYTGCKVSTPKKGDVRVAVIGELDCVQCAEHPDSTPEGNVHACGHHAQLADLYGCAIGLMKSGVMEALDGGIDFIAIPAEECVDYDYRDSLIRDQKISTVDTDANGFVAKTVKFIGQGAHAGFAPFDGINALNMAELALNNIHALRETFRDEDKVRVSAVITEGGGLVNVVPSVVRMQVMVRAFTLDAMLDASKKVNRALKAGALAVGGKVEINDKIGYLPLNTDRSLSALYRKNMMTYAGATEDSFVELYQTAGSTDLGDLSQIMPCMHIWTEGITGGLHSKDYRLADPELAYIEPAKMMALMIIDLLYDQAASAKNILHNFQPSLTKESYLKLQKDHSKLEVFDASEVS